MEKKDKYWDTLKNQQIKFGNVGNLYFQDRKEFDDLLNVLNQMSKEYSDEFFDDRFLMVGQIPTEIEGNKWQVVYSSPGLNDEVAYFTTSSQNKLINVVDLPQSRIREVDANLQADVTSGKRTITSYEQEFLDDNISALEDLKIKDTEKQL